MTRVMGRSADAAHVNDVFTADALALDTGRWYQVAVTGEPTADKKWRVRLFVDGNVVHEGTTRHLAAPLTLPPSAVLGAEIFYFHDAYYRGLLKWQQIPWLTDLREAVRQAKEEKRPLVLFVSGDDPLEKC